MVIKCKEDLVNTYIENDNGALRDMYLALCDKFGFGTYCVRENWFDAKTFGIADHLPPNEVWSNFIEKTKEKCKQLQLSDLIDLENSKVYTTDEEVSGVTSLDEMISELDTKPLTRVEYVKAESPKLSELVVMWENEELYTLSMDDYKIVQDIDRVILLHRDGGAYQRVEKEIDWREEVTKYLENVDSGAGMCDISFNCQEKSLSDESFVKMCHLVTSLTKGE